VELEPAIEGLIHISELAPQRVFRARDIVQVDQQVSVKVLSVDTGARRIGLSLKQALAKDVPADDDAEEEADYATPPPRPYNPNLRGGIS
jgi:small subunit ribosomal protein S1